MKSLRILLNGPFSGPHAGFALAERRSYLADAGISVDWQAGKGASAVIPELLGGGYDAAYGDLNALALALGGLPPGAGPKAIYVSFNQTPLTIAVRAGEGIATPRDLEGRTVLGHTYDAARQMFPALVVATGIDASRVKLIFSEDSLGLMVRRMVETRDCDGVFGFVNTIKASLSEEGLSIEDKVGFIEYRDWLPSFYGNSLLASPALLADAGLARALVEAVAKGFADLRADPEAGIDAVMEMRPQLDRAINLRRLKGTLAIEMNHAERQGVRDGDVDPTRLQEALDLLARAFPETRPLKAREVFAQLRPT